MAKIFTLRGKTLEDMQKMSLEEFAKLLPSRQRRGLTRGMTPIQKKFMIRIRRKTRPVKTHCRTLAIIPEMVGKRVLVHNGHEWVQVDIKEEMLGHRLGEFSQTRKRVMHSAPGVGATKSSKFLPLK